MAEPEPPTQILESYLQADVAARAPRHEEFIGALRRVAKSQGAGEARAWARRAVSPLLDYSSLMALRRFVLPGAKGDGEAALRVAILGGATTVQLRVLIEMFLAGEGIAAEIYEADYGL